MHSQILPDTFKTSMALCIQDELSFGLIFLSFAHLPLRNVGVPELAEIIAMGTRRLQEFAEKACL